MGRFNDLTGQRFNRLTVVSRANIKGRRVYWRCLCDCGRTTVARVDGLQCGDNQSCGCLRDEQAGSQGRTHGMTLTPEHWAWGNMRQRCTNPKFPQFADYGGRGITVCDRWNSFEAFLADVGPRPSSLHSLDRKDNGGNYEPGNVRWATKKQQCRNTRSNRFVTIDGKTTTVVEVAERYGLPIGLIRHRLRRYGSISAAVAGNKHAKHTIDGITATLNSHAKRKGLQPALVRMRICRGWSVERALTAPVRHLRPSKP